MSILLTTATSEYSDWHDKCLISYGVNEFKEQMDGSDRYTATSREEIGEQTEIILGKLKIMFLITTDLRCLRASQK